MSTGFLNKCSDIFGKSAVDVIVKKEFSEFVRSLPSVDNVFAFSGKEGSGFRHMRLFAAQFKGKYDLYFALPGSFSSALTGFLSGIPERIGYSGQFRSFFLTKHYSKPQGLHRAEEFARLLKDYTDDPCSDIRVSLPPVTLEPGFIPEAGSEKTKIIFNINSSGTSRRIPLAKAKRIALMLMEKFDPVLILTGGSRDTEYTRRLEESIGTGPKMINLSGKTSLEQAAGIICEANLVISADSGLAHLSNSMGIPTIVLFGAGDENNTAPYNKDTLCIVKAHGLYCIPCIKNECRHGAPICIENLSEDDILKCAGRFLSGRDHVRQI